MVTLAETVLNPLQLKGLCLKAHSHNVRMMCAAVAESCGAEN